MILTIDQGTTGTTALLVDENGAVQAKAYRDFKQYYPRPGWVEHDAEEIWQTVLDTSGELLDNRKPPQAIGITNQRETIVLWDRESGQPVAPAIVWQDRRTSGICKELKDAGREPDIRQKTGLLLDPYFSGTKLKWLLDHNLEFRHQAETGKLAAGTIDSWLIWKLTGGTVHATDYTNASRTLLFDLKARDWSDDLLDLFHIPRNLLPEARPSACEFGRTVDGPWGAGVLVCGVAGDQQAALFGQGCFQSGLAKNTYGTGCFFLSHRGENSTVSDAPILTTMAASAELEPLYAVEGSVFIAGAAVQWLRDEMGLIQDSAECEPVALSVNDTGGVYVIPAFSGLGAPHWNSDARGAILGITRGTNRAHIVRATLEAIAFQVADLVSIPELGSGIVELRVDGGACRNDLLMQMQADLLGIPVNRPKNIETTATGAAYLAGLGAGIWNSTEDLGALREVDRIFEPQMSENERMERIQEWHKALKRVL